jgi:N-acetyl-gamma-glutamyl-phosphate reductase
MRSISRETVPQAPWGFPFTLFVVLVFLYNQCSEVILMVDVAIIGATGYGGVELIRLLHRHPQVRLAYLHSESYAGKRLRDVYPHLSWVSTELRPLDPEAVAKECSYALLSVPAGETMELAPKLLERGLRVVDVAPDYRLHDPALYPQWYNFEHTHPELLEEAVTGIPEWHREKIAAARLVAATGCYAAAAQLALMPLVADGLIEPDDIVLDGKTGVSGAGRSSLKLDYHFPEADEDAAAYSVGGHRHAPEVIQALQALTSARVSLSLTPHLVPMSRGILLTAYAKVARGTDAEALRASLARRYDDEPFVHLLPPGVWPHTKWTAGTNHCFLAVGVDRISGRAIVVSVLDNLGKGMAGQMVQCLNVMMGVPETTGLEAAAAYP